MEMVFNFIAWIMVLAVAVLLAVLVFVIVRAIYRVANKKISAYKLRKEKEKHNFMLHYYNPKTQQYCVEKGDADFIVTRLRVLCKARAIYDKFTIE